MSQIILCSADAGPDSQRQHSEKAGYFFSGAAGVGATRNVAEKVGCRFMILTTGHGLVDCDEIIFPYDLHILPYKQQVTEIWKNSISVKLMNNQNSLMVFYASGCPRELYTEVLTPILLPLGISLLTFGKPNMFDIDKMENIIQLLISGTSFAQIGSILKHPERLEFYYHVA
jgi:hypothetical protein